MATSPTTRREFVRSLLSSAAGASFASSVFAQGTPTGRQAAPAIVVKKLTDTIALLTGDGGNVAVVIGTDGLMMVDGGLANRSMDLVKAIGDVDGRPVRILFNTHYHYDHVGANELLGSRGTKIIAHENVKRRLTNTIVSEAMNATFQPLKPEGVPVETFMTSGALTFGSERIQYAHIPTAHTDGDSYVFFAQPNILHTGDLLWNGLYPVIDYSVDGWIGGMILALETLMAIGDVNTRVIPGHGPLATKSELKASLDMLATIQERLLQMARAGKSLDEVLASAPTRDLDEKWSRGRPPDTFLRQAYRSLLLR